MSLYSLFFFSGCSRDHSMHTSLFTVFLQSIVYHPKLNAEIFHCIDPFLLPFILYCFIQIYWKSWQTAIMIAFNCDAYFKELKRRKIVYFIYLDIHYFCFSSFSFDFPVFLLVSFPFSTKNFLYSSSVALNSHSFPSPENVFISSSVLFNCLKMCCFFLTYLRGFTWEIHSHSNCYCIVSSRLFFSGHFQDFFRFL